jgi:ABC-type sugar transport system substrate-binding protein
LWLTRVSKFGYKIVQCLEEERMKLYTMIISFVLCVLLSSSYGAPLKVYFLGESSSQDDVWLYRVDCMRKTANEIGADFHVYFAEGDYQRHAQLLEEAVAQGAEAIISPLWDASPYTAAISKAIQQGVFVYGMLGIEPIRLLPNDVSEYCGYIDADWKAFGRQLAAIAMDWTQERMHILWPAETINSRYTLDAIDGFCTYFSDHGILIHVETIQVGFDAEQAASTIKKHLENNTKTTAIVTSGAIGQVVCPEAIRGIREGYMPSGINLELTDSSYHAILDVFATVKLDVAPSHRLVGLTQVNRSNLETVVPRGIIDLCKTFTR